MRRLVGKTAVITGPGTGPGRVMAGLFALEGTPRVHESCHQRGWTERNALQPARLDRQRGRGRRQRRARDRPAAHLGAVSLRDISTTEDLTNLTLVLASDESGPTICRSIVVDAAKSSAELYHHRFRKDG